MARVIQSLSDLIGKRVDLLIICSACDHRRTVDVARVVRLFANRGWSGDWRTAAKRFRCGQCGGKAIKLDADFYGAAVRRQHRATLAVVPPALLPGLRPPPPGVSIEDWNSASERERKRLVDRSRS